MTPTATALISRAAARSNDVPDRPFIRTIMSLVAGRGSTREAERFAENTNWADKETVTRSIGQLQTRAAVAAGSTTDADFGLAISLPGLAAFLDRVRARTVIGKLTDVRRVPFIRGIGFAISDASFGWVKEGSPTPVSRPTWDSASLPIRKVGGINVISEELARTGTAAAEELIRRAMRDGLVRFLDTSFLDPTLAEVADTQPASVTNGAPSTAATADPQADIIALLGDMLDDHDTLEGTILVMSDRNAIAIASTLSTDKLGAGGGELYGVPVVTSSSAGTSIIAIHTPMILLAQEDVIELDTSRQATLQMNDAPTDPPVAATVMTSLYQANLVGVKALLFANFAKMADDAVQLITGAAY